MDIVSNLYFMYLMIQYIFTTELIQVTDIMRLTVEKVSQAIAELTAQNQKPTNRAIIKYLGYGSFSILSKLRQTHPEIFAITDSQPSDYQFVDRFYPLFYFNHNFFHYAAPGALQAFCYSTSKTHAD